jgi:hypothetical protein
MIGIRWCIWSLEPKRQNLQMNSLGSYQSSSSCLFQVPRVSCRGLEWQECLNPTMHVINQKDSLTTVCYPFESVHWATFYPIPKQDGDSCGGIQSHCGLICDGTVLATSQEMSHTIVEDCDIAFFFFTDQTDGCIYLWKTNADHKQSLLLLLQYTSHYVSASMRNVAKI